MAGHLPRELLAAIRVDVGPAGGPLLEELQLALVEARDERRLLRGLSCLGGDEGRLLHHRLAHDERPGDDVPQPFSRFRQRDGGDADGIGEHRLEVDQTHEVAHGRR